jgi:hypothetical protein
MHRLGQVAFREPVRSLTGPFVSERHRRCRRCAHPFVDGLVIVERGYITTGVCQSCLEQARSGSIDAEELFPA